MWPRGTTAEKLALLDDRLASCATVLGEARAHDNLSLVAELEERCQELLDERLDVMRQAAP